MSQPTRILLALIAGLAIGLALTSWSGITRAVAIAEPIGQLWLTGLQMTIVPLVVSLLVTGIAQTAEAARASRLAGRALALFILILFLSAAYAAVATPLLLDLFPLPEETAAALRATFASATAEVAEAPGFADFVASILPSNPISAAANSAMLPLILFTLVFAFALSRLPAERRQRLVGFFEALADVMLVMVNWVLALAPIGVFALAFAVGSKAGAEAFGALVHYVIMISGIGILIWALAVPFGIIGGRIAPGRFLKAIGPSQAVALSTQSSLASLPTMLRGAEVLGVPVAASGIILPMAVALFRATGPAMNLAVALYVAHMLGIEVTATALFAAVVVAALTNLGSVSLPGQVSFITSVSPICAVLGVPIAPLAILVAVEMIPDIFRTLGNVTMDLAATATVSRGSGIEASEEDRLLGGENPPPVHPE